MASRLYRTTRQLYIHVQRCVHRLGVRTLGTPTLAVLIALNVTGLLLLDARPTQTRVTRLLPGRCHNALNRLLRTMPLSTRAIVLLLLTFAKRLDRDGYLCLDDVIVEKAYASQAKSSSMGHIMWRGLTSGSDV